MKIWILISVFLLISGLVYGSSIRYELHTADFKKGLPDWGYFNGNVDMINGIFDLTPINPSYREINLIPVEKNIMFQYNNLTTKSFYMHGYIFPSSTDYYFDTGYIVGSTVVVLEFRNLGGYEEFLVYKDGYMVQERAVSNSTIFSIMVSQDGNNVTYSLILYQVSLEETEEVYSINFKEAEGISYVWSGLYGYEDNLINLDSVSVYEGQHNITQTGLFKNYFPELGVVLFSLIIIGVELYIKKRGGWLSE